MIALRSRKTRGMRVAFGLTTMTVVSLMLAGCALATPTDAGTTPTPSPTPTAACPQVEGVDLPPDCAPYDPEHSMAQNDRYRDRMEMPEGSQAAADESAAVLRTSLESIRSSGAISVDAVEEAARGADLSDITARGDERSVEFGAAAPEGGCVFGQISADAVTVEVGGYIMDGGCLPMQ